MRSDDESSIVGLAVVIVNVRDVHVGVAVVVENPHLPILCVRELGIDEVELGDGLRVLLPPPVFSM
jgi:hypothetical protein